MIQSLVVTKEVICITTIDNNFKRSGREVVSQNQLGRGGWGLCAVNLSFLEFGDDFSLQNLSESIGAIIASHRYLSNHGLARAGYEP